MRNGNLGCYVNGILKYQSKDTESVHEYARKKMNDLKRPDVWVARVGSFVHRKGEIRLNEI